MKRKLITVVLSIAVTLALIPTMAAYADDLELEGTPPPVLEEVEDQQEPLEIDVEEDEEVEDDVDEEATDEVELPKINLKSPVTQVRESKLDEPFTYTLIARVGEKVIDPALVTWTSDNEAVATVSPEGVVTVIGVGKANFTAVMIDGTARNGYAKVFVFPEKSQDSQEPAEKPEKNKNHN